MLTVQKSRAEALGGTEFISPGDLEDFSLAKKLLLNALKTGRELTKPEMRALTGQDSADRRVRELRADLEPQGWTIERCHKGGRTYTYKLEKLQQELL